MNTYITKYYIDPIKKNMNRLAECDVYKSFWKAIVLCKVDIYRVEKQFISIFWGLKILYSNNKVIV